jgi:hypothetical protein
MGTPNYALLLQVDRHLEDGVTALLRVQGVKVFKSRDTETATSPRVEVVCKLGPVQNHVYTFQDGVRWAWDAWTAVLTTTIVTNRTDTTNRTLAHQNLLGLVRNSLQMFQLAPGGQTPWRHPILAITDIREAGTVEQFVDADDLDNSVVEWNCLINIREDLGLWENLQLIATEDGVVIEFPMGQNADAPISINT